jgi:hypothetical protein
MSILTRIKNNQVTDNTIEFQKLKDGTLVGSKFNANLTLNSNVTILGNLTVANSFAQLNSINTYINDPIVVYNNNYTSSPTYDIGILVNRNLSSLAPYGSVNAALVWRESETAFAGLMTTETGTTTGSINNSGFANLIIGNITANTTTIRDSNASTSTTTGALVVTGGAGIGGAVNIGGITKVAGNLVAHSGTQSTSTTTGALVVVGGVGISANTTIGQNLVVQGNAIISGNLLVSGAQVILGTTDLAVIDAVINIHTLANLAPWTVNDGKDIGLKFHYYDGVDSHAFLGRVNSSRSLEFYGAGTEGSGNTFTGTAYGTIKAGEFFSANTTDSSSIATGAFRTFGGAGIYSNVFVGKSATFNANSATNQDFKIRGVNSTNLFWARSATAYDQVLIGNTIATGSLTGGSKLTINSSDSMIIPVGTTAQRPSNAGFSDVVGMFRFNTTQTALEVYNGADWDIITTQFTVITTETFSGDDTTTVFTMAGTSTTAATIVAINGVLQTPTTAYSVSGTTLTFTEAPATGDSINVRRLLTTSTVTAISSTNGYMQVTVDNSLIQLNTGAGAPTLTTAWNVTGAEINYRSNITVVTDAVPYEIDYFDGNLYSSAEFTVTSTIQNTNIREIAKILAVHNNANATITTFGIVNTAGNSLTTFTANIVTGNVRIYANVTNPNTVIRIDSVLQAL